MAKSNGPDLEKLKAMIAAIHERHTQIVALLNEVDTVLGGGVAMGDLLKWGERTFSELHGARYPGKYVWQYGKDRPQLKRLILALGTEELGARMRRYLQNDDEFFRKARHSFGLFVSTINQHAAPAPPVASTAANLELTEAGVERPAWCQHTPPCADDVAHTQRRRQELHAAIVQERRALNLSGGAT